MAWENPKTNWGQLGQTVPGVDDFNRIEGNIDILGKYDRAPGYGTATGTNTKTITLSPAPGSYYDGLCFAFKNSVENTGAVTINVNGLGAKAVKKPNGNDIAAGNLKAGSVYTVRYNGTNFILQGSDSSGNATPEHVLAGKTFSNDNDTGITGTMPNRGAVSYIITTQGGEYEIPAGYHNGNGAIAASFDNLTPENVRYNVNVGGIIGTLDLKYQRLFLNNFDDEGVDVVLGNIPAYGTKYVNISVPAGRKAVILYNLFVAYARPPWTGKFDVWNNRVFLKSIQVIDDTTWKLKFENEYEVSQACGRFYMHIFYV
jgi:hypothetical protein